jgi:hypothetical protein
MGLAHTILAIAVAATCACLPYADDNRDVGDGAADAVPAVDSTLADEGADEGVGGGDSEAGPCDTCDAGADGSDGLTALEHVRLWLAADWGPECQFGPDPYGPGTVVRWPDKSGHHNDAFPAPGHSGPICNDQQHLAEVDAGFAVPMPYFSAPPEDGGDLLEGTLDVDLSFLAQSSYTIFVVERRWFGPPTNQASTAELFLGTTVPPTDELTGRACPARANQALQLGYFYSSNVPRLTFDQTCNGMGSDLPGAPDGGPLPFSQETFEFALSGGHEFWVNGTPVNANLDLRPLASAQGGAIGRGLVQTTAAGLDPRYRGDISEIIVYDTALGEEERTAVEQRLAFHWHLQPH